VEQRTVGEIVKGRPVYVVHEVDSVLDATRYMTEYGAEAVPVLAEGDLVGIFSERDVMTRVVAIGRDPAFTKVGEVMTTRVAVVGTDTSCQDALTIMRTLCVRHLPVMVGKRLVGCVSLKELQAVETETRKVEPEFLDGSVEQNRRRKMGESPNVLADRVRAVPGGEHLSMCYSCGTCVGSCPIQLTGEPTYNPRRLILKTMLSLEEQVFEDRTTWLCSACDLCYSACPQKIHVSGVLSAVKELAIQAGHRTVLQTAVVNEVTCVACGLCVQVCPYDAIALAEKRSMGQTRTVASVDPNRCMACGLCAAICRSASIELPDRFSSEALIDDLWQWMQSTEPVLLPAIAVKEWAESVADSIVE
jgi:heterodisulfide reductase subunit C2